MAEATALVRPLDLAQRLRDSAPSKLRVGRQWVCWRYEGKNGKGRKIPVNPATGKAASSTNPRTWGTFDDALEAYTQGRGAVDGVGFVFTQEDDFLGVDLDDCIDDDGNMRPSAAEIVERFRSTYIEVSPSGHGVKIIAIGRKPAGRCVGDSIECYGKGRYFTITGHRWPDTGADVCDCQSALDWLYEQHMAGRTVGTETGRDADTHPPTLTSNNSNDSGNSITSVDSAHSVTVEQAIERTLPRKPGERNKCIFELARALKFDCGLGGRPLKEMKPIVRDWHAKALPNIETKAFDETWADFGRGWKTAKYPLLEVLSTAWRQVAILSLPEEEDYDSAPVRLLVRLCYVLAGEDGRFFLSSHVAAALLGKQPQQAYRWLGMLVGDELLQIVEKGNARRATRYRWLGQSCPGRREGGSAYRDSA